MLIYINKCQQEKRQKNAKNYYCEICDVTSNKLSEYKIHLDTKNIHQQKNAKINKKNAKINQKNAKKRQKNI